MRKTKWCPHLIKTEALKYKTRSDFQKKSRGAYKAAYRLNILEEVCGHMPKRVDISGINSVNFKWSFEKLKEEALKYSTRVEFQNKNASAYIIALKRKILDKICTHMPVYTRKGEQNPRFVWTDEMLQKEALKYETKQEFRENSYAAYLACKRRKILNQLCSHMSMRVYSYQEELLLIKIKEFFPSAHKLKLMNITIERRPYIKGFEIDIFVPELQLGIEFDGTYWHSFNGLKNTHRKWPINAIKNYHSIKDKFFKTKGIDILHIKEDNWIVDKEKCIEQCFLFLRGQNVKSRAT